MKQKGEEEQRTTRSIQNRANILTGTHKRRYINAQKAHEKAFNISSHQEMTHHCKPIRMVEL